MKLISLFHLTLKSYFWLIISIEKVFFYRKMFFLLRKYNNITQSYVRFFKSYFSSLKHSNIYMKSIYTKSCCIISIKDCLFSNKKHVLPIIFTFIVLLWTYLLLNSIYLLSSYNCMPHKVGKLPFLQYTCMV